MWVVVLWLSVPAPLDAALDPRLSAVSLCQEEKEQAGFNRPVWWPVGARHVTF